MTTSVLVPLEESVYNPATGETVSFAGDVRFLVRTKTLADGSVLVSIQDNGFIPGTGDTSGNQYNLQFHNKFQFSFNAPAFPLTVTLTCDMHIKNAGSCNDVGVPMTVQFTIQKDGSVSAKYVEDGGGDITP